MCCILFVVVWFLWFILQDHKLLWLWHIDALAPTGAGNTNWNIKEQTHTDKRRIHLEQQGWVEQWERVENLEQS